MMKDGFLLKCPNSYWGEGVTPPSLNLFTIGIKHDGGKAKADKDQKSEGPKTKGAYRAGEGLVGPCRSQKRRRPLRLPKTCHIEHEGYVLPPARYLDGGPVMPKIGIRER
jgi:hypothetical protein